MNYKVILWKYRKSWCNENIVYFKFNERLDIDNIWLRLFLMIFEWKYIKYMKYKKYKK